MRVAPEFRAAPAFDVAEVRREFPALHQEVHGKPLVYLDNAATSQKPQAVIDAIVRYYTRDNANVHRGVHELSERATRGYEEARGNAQRFLGAGDAREIIFVRGATEGINLVASSFVRPRLAAGDEIVVSAMEHHSNIVPWQLLCEERGATLRVIPIDDAGDLILEAFEQLLTPRTRLVAINHVSNTLGTVNPIAEIIALAHARSVPVLVDGAQAAPHVALDVRALDCDFYVISGHKVYAPTGIGVLYGKLSHLEAMPPFQSGGDMIRSVTFERTTFGPLPAKFEAGTPHIAGAIGLGAALDYVRRVGIAAIEAHERDVLAYATGRLQEIPGLRIIGTARRKAGVISFVVEGIHPHDIGTILDHEGIAVRAGHNCTQPLMDRFGIPATARASLAMYNTREEIDRLCAAIGRAVEVFS